jgi:hypothetical protein
MNSFDQMFFSLNWVWDFERRSLDWYTYMRTILEDICIDFPGPSAWDGDGNKSPKTGTNILAILPILRRALFEADFF